MSLITPAWLSRAHLNRTSSAKAPVIIQVSQGGAAFFGGKGLENKNQEASIAGAVAAGHYVRCVT